MKIFIDDREKKVIPHFTDIMGYKQYKFEWEVVRLTHADYMIVHEGKIVALVERKTWKDLASSIIDKRILNVENLKILRDRAPGLHIILMMEGTKPGRDQSKGNVPYPNMRAKLDHLMMRDNITVDFSSNPLGTCIRLAEIMKNYISIDPPLKFDLEKHQTVEKEVRGEVSQCQEIIEKKEEKDALMGWCALPGVDIATTTIIRRAGYSLSEVLVGKLTVDKLAEMQYISGFKVGEERASSIIKALALPKTHLAIISSVRGISDEVARLILSHYGTIQSLINDGSVHEISNLKKKKFVQPAVVMKKGVIKNIGGSKSTKLGDVIAQRLFDVLEAKQSTDL